VLVLILNIIPQLFFSVFDQPRSFIDQAVPVLRVVSVGMIMMSMANVWLNAVTGTGKTRVNLAIEIIAILIYLLHSLYFTQWHFQSLPMSWTNEFVYWGSIGLMAATFLWSKRWMKKPYLEPTKN
jgi:Na+-driven multidrug efflux pump